MRYVSPFVYRVIVSFHGGSAVLGAGISVQAGIPDFRSETGLFQSLKKDHSCLSSGKDLFDASVFNVSASFIIAEYRSALGHVEGK